MHSINGSPATYNGEQIVSVFADMRGSTAKVCNSMLEIKAERIMADLWRERNGMEPLTYGAFRLDVEYPASSRRTSRSEQA